MVTLPLLVTKDGDRRLWGIFQFVSVPSPGDTISITDHADKVQRLTVSHVAHEPILGGHEPRAGRHYAWVHAVWDDQFN